MLAVVKTPHIEISLNGAGAKEAVSWLSKKFDVEVISPDAPESETVNIDDTEFWTEMQRNRVGNLLEAARLKAGFTQEQAAKTMGVKQNMISDYENGRRRLSQRMAQRFADALGVKVERFFNRK
ncbi:MAG: hypothetical protein A2268_10750 [Candidatus Raymondbacteria bacterium RifOxyA12_full_50_37]|uniref:HTH cro/C1-type domain-containing protein n=1 Tax=Candidatus Raymondbacteria bacterium RIFOXYD12_FULL_49_13 TaxID=1817890 RepID=A0A1F7F972_UNCRA|nr:MAG: hypothetical protein A2268_10750 [Candidatus Raymondbacteria bacterium RifOxyA12_full_50_37]OGJ85441.1 MAG: hypothetical protein A2248_12535 [Candidatus Raymondbacteria bacterium RIFOXYA2_FULL_49_16]OGJ91040.1 MAG: hypothetical protein A2350_07375 [Candidatus Raymondbacteria bacterium RifOxyB12_full_50_8]OGJ94949.1 MAG: hypothetical protein A2453_08005 [Candidatus Raymondbacteria bacterium RIFOXYC2_FULL_50_21]OGK03066.1 MAG: hypothetical protein A2519_21495 [Candidatus Raymondbacteria b